jgi:hypothetical protein
MFDALSRRYSWCTPERFVQLSPKFLFYILPVVGRADLVEFYTSVLSYKAAFNPELPSLSELLGTELSQEKDNTVFDTDIDKRLETHAKMRLEERRKQHARR